MSGIFGCASKNSCIGDLFYGTDYLSHLGTKISGMAVLTENEIKRVIHSLASSYFRTKFESEFPDLEGSLGIGVISDYEVQPILMRSHLGLFGLVTVLKINNIMNPTELVAKLICERDSISQGIAYAQECIEGFCTMLLVSDNGEIFAARNRLG